MKTALITGAGRGIGFSTAREFLQAGWRVLSLDKQFGPEIVGERLDFDLRSIPGIPALVGLSPKSETKIISTLCIEMPEERR